MGSDAVELRVVVVDDEPPARRRLKEVLQDCAGALPLALAGEAANGLEALELLSRQPADVVLVDIRMPDMDGIELASHIQRLPQPPAVVFVTAYEDFAVKAFELNAVDYLLKPVRAERLLHALRKAGRMSSGKLQALREAAPAAPARLSVYERGRILLVPVEDIVYLKSELKYVTVRTQSREFLVEESLSRLEQEYGSRFIRIHRSCLVARAYVEGFERTAPGKEGHGGWVVLLRGVAEKLPVSRRQHHIIREFGRGPA
jgi:two-component system response regulator AlgR